MRHDLNCFLMVQIQASPYGLAGETFGAFVVHGFLDTLVALVTVIADVRCVFPRGDVKNLNLRTPRDRPGGWPEELNVLFPADGLTLFPADGFTSHIIFHYIGGLI